MEPSTTFSSQDKRFWAHVRWISQEMGYSVRGKDAVSVPEFERTCIRLRERGLGIHHLIADGEPTDFGETLWAYFRYRAQMLNGHVREMLMNVDEAAALFEELKERYSPKTAIPMNKQTLEKKKPNYLAAMVNTLVEAHLDGLDCNYNPRELTTITRDGEPLRTFSRWLDGAVPDTVNPIAVWENKEFYHTTTFGSRVADGVYESILDGMEIEELREHEGIDIRHYLFVDSHFTWWVKGKSYLCRLVDSMHMGYIDEVVFGREVVDRVPPLVQEWGRIWKEHN